MSLCYIIRKDWRNCHCAHSGSFSGAYRQACGMEQLTDDVLYYIASILDLDTLQAWRATCTRMDAIGGAVLTGRYHRRLRRYFADPVGFRSVLRVTGSVISGSVALHVLDRDRAGGWEPLDLDVFAPVHLHKRVHSYLTKVEGYVLVGTHTPTHHEECFGFLSVSRYENADGMHVDLIKSFTHSSIYPIPYFWSTHVMNYLSADSFCIAYPTLTLEGRSLLNPVALLEHQFPDDRIMYAMNKYMQRGYDFRCAAYAWKADAKAECAREDDEGCPRTIRYFGDRFCLTGTFNTLTQATRSNESRAQPDKALLVRWWRGGYACGGNCRHVSDFSNRFFPHTATHRVPSGFYDAFVGGHCIDTVTVRSGM